MSEADIAFVRHKSRFAVAWALCNLQRLHKHASLTSAGQPLAGRTAVVVGAGPSLQRNGKDLRRAQRKGIAIFAVNSSDGPLRALGVVPDVLVARESVDLGEDIAATQAPCIALDVCAHPSMWDAAADRLAWFVPGYPRHLQVCQRLGVRPVFAGTSAANTAVAIARQWGASRIVLVGSDLALADDGRAYHPDAARLRDLQASVETLPGGQALRFRGWDENAELCQRSGQITQPELQRFSWVASADWSRVLPAIDTWADQRAWLEIEARRHGHALELINATEGGGGIVGWRNDTLAAVVGRETRQKPLVVPAVYPVSEADNEALVSDLRRETGLMRAVSEAMIAKGAPSIATLLGVQDLALGTPLLESLSAWREIDAPRGDPAKRAGHIYRARIEACAEAERILGGGDGAT